MVLYLESLDQVLTRHVIFMEVLSKCFEKWGVEFPFTLEELDTMKVARVQVRSLLDQGVTEVPLPDWVD